MIQTFFLTRYAHPYGVSLHRVSYMWSDLPESVKMGERDPVDTVSQIATEKLGCGEWLAGPLLYDGVWRGLWMSYGPQPASPNHKE